MSLEYKATDLPGKSLYIKEFSCSIRPITPIEQKYILSLSQKDQRSTIDYMNFLKKLVQFDNPEMTFEQMFWYDVQYLLYRIRFLTYPKYPIKLGFKCMDCGETISHELDIGRLDIKEPAPDMPRTIMLDNLGEISIRNKTVIDDLTVEEFGKKKGIDTSDIQMRLLLLDLCLISREKTLDELYSLTENADITANDIVTIENWFADNEWGIKEEVNVKCPHCKKEASRGYMLSIEDFFSYI